jgi:hypothetical protein
MVWVDGDTEDENIYDRMAAGWESDDVYCV